MGFCEKYASKFSVLPCAKVVIFRKLSKDFLVYFYFAKKIHIAAKGAKTIK